MSLSDQVKLRGAGHRLLDGLHARKSGIEVIGDIEEMISAGKNSGIIMLLRFEVK
jgi:hypothetical protein